MKTSILAFALLSLVLLTRCSGEGTEPYAPGTAGGYRLARQHCTGCHGFAPAGLIGRRLWEKNVLPDMAGRLGIRVSGESGYMNDPDHKPALPYDEWMQIVDYYLKSAPTELRAASPGVKLTADSQQFLIRRPAMKPSRFAKTVLAFFDTASSGLYTGEGNDNRLYRWNNDLEITDSLLLPSPPVSISIDTSSGGRRMASVATLGRMALSSQPEGQLLQLNLQQPMRLADTIASQLPRPVQTLAADLDNDGLTDRILCGFGHESGGLYWFRQQPGGNYEKRALLALPGATNAVAQDFNNDGWTDILVLFAHGDECIRLFTNNRNGSFSHKKILSFPPVYGSTSFQLTDFNSDGQPDILYTCGDNGDLSMTFKPYHGVYIFLNKGGFNMQQEYFYPVNGCTRAVAADFDLDGDLDIASIAFFADFSKSPGEGFVWFRQEAGLRFTPLSVPVGKDGRWICMDVNDYDRDGDPDVVLGNFAYGFPLVNRNFRAYWNMHQPVVVLENRAR